MENDRFAGISFSEPHALSLPHILNAALDAVNPYVAVQKALRFDQGVLKLSSENQPSFRIAVSADATLRLVGLGKAAGQMVAAASAVLGDIPHVGIVVGKFMHNGLPTNIQQVLGGHPVPSQGSLEAGKGLRQFLSAAKPGDVVLFLLSGGGSALATLPISGVSLEDTQTLTQELLRAGATIQQINSIRKQIDQVKGGGLARMAQPATCAVLILSDVIGNALDVIASGPAIADPTTPADALSIISSLGIDAQVPPGILAALQNLTLVPRHAVPSIPHIIISDNQTALSAACKQAEREGYMVTRVQGHYTGDVADVAKRFIQEIKLVSSDHRSNQPIMLAWGGEPTVRVSGNGLGGRNQHLALELLAHYDLKPGECIICLATDGDDGPTDAAGAFIDEYSLSAGQAHGYDIKKFLQNNDSYHYFEGTGNLLRIGPTGTNVNDLLFYLRS